VNGGKDQGFSVPIGERSMASGQRRYLGRFSTALEAALHVARNLGPAWRSLCSLFS